MVEHTTENRGVASSILALAIPAKAFVEMFGDFVRYDHARDRWLVWDQHRWRPDNDTATFRMALSTSRARHRAAEADHLTFEDRKALSVHAIKSESRSRLELRRPACSTVQRRSRRTLRADECSEPVVRVVLRTPLEGDNPGVLNDPLADLNRAADRLLPPPDLGPLG